MGSKEDREPERLANASSTSKHDRTMASSDKRGRAAAVRYCLLACTTISTFFFVGAIFGWGPMQLMLEGNGSFHRACDDAAPIEDIIVCEEQTNSLLRIAIIMSVTQVLSPILGHIMDTIGAPSFASLQAGVAIFGMALVSVGIQVDSVEWILYIGFACVATATWIGSLLIIQLSFYFSGHTGSRVIFVLNTVFDSGALTYWILWIIQRLSGGSLLQVWVGYTLFAFVTYAISVYLWIVAVPETVDETEQQNVTKPRSSVLLEDLRSSVFVPQRDDDWDGSSVGLKPPSSFRFSSADSHPKNPMVASFSVRSGDSVVSHRHQLCSSPFLCLVLFFSLQVLSTHWNFVTQRDFLAYLGDNDVGNRYLTIFTLMTPVSIISTPFVDYMILNYGWTASLQCINVLGLAFSMLKVASTDLNVQIAGFVLFSFFRGSLFGISFSFLPTLVSDAVVGKASGIVFFCTGIMSLLTIGLASLAVKKLEGNFFIPNLCFVFLNFPCMLAIYMLSKLIHPQETQKQQGRQEQSKEEVIEDAPVRYIQRPEIVC